MIKKTITYTDTDGIKRTEDFYFNLTKAELLEMEVSHVGGFEASLRAMIKRDSNQEVLSIIKEIILSAYGERSDVSRHFIKKPEFAEAFSHTEAYSELFVELFTHADKAAEFFEGLMPADLLAQVKAEQQARLSGQHSFRAPSDHLKKAEKVVEPETIPQIEPDVVPDVKSPRTITAAQAREMDLEHIQAFFLNGGQIEG